MTTEKNRMTYQRKEVIGNATLYLGDCREILPTHRGRTAAGKVDRMSIILPFPPSVNRMWRTVRGRPILSRAGREYRESVALACVLQSVAHYDTDTLAMSVRAYMPDARRRDVDNLFKAPLDALCHAGVYDDDSQIRRLSIEYAGIDRGNPRIEVTIELC